MVGKYLNSTQDSHTALFLYERLLLGPLLANRTVVSGDFLPVPNSLQDGYLQVLVTHNVELVLPGAYYLVRMLDGRIDTQGTVEQLRAQGILDAIAHDSSLERQPEVKATQPDTKQSSEEDEDKSRKPRQLVKDEARETGSVKWRIYKTYMKASSYWTWAILTFLICVYQVLVVIEKLWIKQWGDVSNPMPQTL